MQGLDTVPPDRRPPVNVVRVAFQPMVGIGTLLALLGVVATSPCACGADGCPSRAGSTARVALAGPLSVVALIAGWVTTEVGRQPWVVYQRDAHSQAVTGAGGIPVGYATLALVYLALGGRGRLDSAAARPRAAASLSSAPPSTRPGEL